MFVFVQFLYNTILHCPPYILDVLYEEMQCFLFFFMVFVKLFHCEWMEFYCPKRPQLQTYFGQWVPQLLDLRTDSFPRTICDGG